MDPLHKEAAHLVKLQMRQFGEDMEARDEYAADL